jgi:hypothetical protein
MTDRLHELETAIKTLDDKLRPFVKLLVNRKEPGWLEGSRLRLREDRPAVDRADIRQAAEQALTEAVDLYRSGSDAERETIRALFRACDSYAWAVPLPRGALTEALFRTHIAVFSIRDQGEDWRSAILWLDDLCASAQKAGLAIADALAETAELSSHAISFELVRRGRSTRDILFDYAGRYGGRSAAR